MSFKRLLVAVDDSPIAARAAEVGTELARALHAELAFVHVVDTMAGYAPESDIPAAELVALAEREGRMLLEQLARRAVGVDRPPMTFSASGKPAHEIVEAAKGWSADAIVVGSHGLRGVKRALLGSVAEGVMRHAVCPVLVVRAPD